MKESEASPLPIRPPLFGPGSVLHLAGAMVEDEVMIVLPIYYWIDQYRMKGDVVVHEIFQYYYSKQDVSIYSCNAARSHREETPTRCSSLGAIPPEEAGRLLSPSSFQESSWDCSCVKSSAAV